MRVAAHHPELIKTLTLMNTTANKEKLSSRLRYDFLAQLVKIVGTGPFTSIAVKELFGESTRRSAEKQPMLEAWTGKLRTRPKNIAKSLQSVMNRRAIRKNELDAIQCPTLIITGADDTAQPPENSKSLIGGIRGARLVTIPGAGHSSSLEQPEAVIAAIQELLRQSASANQQAVEPSNA